MNKLQWKLHYREQRISSKEEWKQVVGYEGLYEVSSFGRIRSLSYNKTGISKMLKQSISKWYYNVHISKLWVAKTIPVHRIVAYAFIKNTYNYPVVNHINMNALDNRQSNLEWCTQLYNVRASLIRWRYEENNILKIKSKLWLFIKWDLHHLSVSVSQYTKDGVYIRTFWCMSDIYRELWIDVGSISSVCKWRRKTAGWYIWKSL